MTDTIEWAVVFAEATNFEQKFKVEYFEGIF